MVEKESITVSLQRTTEKYEDKKNSTKTTVNQVLCYPTYIFHWIIKFGFRTIVINLLILAFILVIFFESGKDTILIEPFEVPEELAKQRGYTGRATVNKLGDALNSIATHSSVVVTIAPQFSSKNYPQDNQEQRPGMFESHPIEISSQTEQLDIQIPGAGISMNSIIQYVRRWRKHEPARVIGEIITDGKKLKITVRVKGKPAKVFTGREENLKDVLHRAARHIYKHTKPIILAGYLINNNHNDDACIEIIKDIISQKTNKYHHLAYAMWGYILQRQGKFKDAMKKYKKSIASDQKFASAHNDLANVLARLGKTGDAIDHFKNAIKIDSGFATAYFGWGYILADQGNFEDAMKKFKKAIKLDSTFTPAHIGLGYILAEQRKYEDALKEFHEALEINPENADAYIGWGSMLAEQRKYPEVIEKYLKAIKLDPQNADAYIGWGSILAEQRKYPEVIEKYLKAIELDPQSISFIGYSLNEALAKLEYKGADEAYQKVIKLDPQNADAYGSWGRMLVGQGKVEDAIEKYLKAIELDPQSISFIGDSLNEALAKLEYKGADEAYQKVVELDPQNADAYGSWGRVLAEQRKYPEAIEKYQKAIELNPDGSEGLRKYIDELEKGVKIK